MVVEIQPKHLNIPVFTDFGLFLPNTSIPVPRNETYAGTSGLTDLFLVGEYWKGQVFMFRPAEPGQPLVIFEHRSIHGPQFQNGLTTSENPNFGSILKGLVEKEETRLDKENYFKNVAIVHRSSQEFLRDHWAEISRILDPSLESINQPRCFLEEGVKSVNGDGIEIDVPIDAVGITQSGKIFIIEVASRKKHDDEFRRSKKYKQVITNSDLFKIQYGKNLEIVEACLFYEQLDDNTVYLSLRYPQKDLQA